MLGLNIDYTVLKTIILVLIIPIIIAIFIRIKADKDFENFWFKKLK